MNLQYTQHEDGINLMIWKLNLKLVQSLDFFQQPSFNSQGLATLMSGRQTEIIQTLVNIRTVTVAALVIGFCFLSFIFGIVFSCTPVLSCVISRICNIVCKFYIDFVISLIFYQLYGSVSSYRFLVDVLSILPFSCLFVLFLLPDFAFILVYLNKPGNRIWCHSSLCYNIDTSTERLSQLQDSTVFVFVCVHIYDKRFCFQQNEYCLLCCIFTIWMSSAITALFVFFLFFYYDLFTVCIYQYTIM